MNKFIISAAVCIVFIILLIVFLMRLVNHWKYERANKSGIFIDIAIIVVSIAVILFTALMLIKIVLFNDSDTVYENTKPASLITTTVATPLTQSATLTAPISTTIVSSNTKQTTTVKKENKSIKKSKTTKKAKVKKKAKKAKSAVNSTAYNNAAQTTYTTAYRPLYTKKTTAIKGIFAEKKNTKFKAKKIRKK